MTSTELVPHKPVDTLDRAQPAWILASKIADTEFVPKGLRGKPEAVLACILAGHEAGVGPMASLAKIHVIEGRPALAAELMRAIVMARGHELVFEEKSNTAVTIAGKRAGSTKWSRITWTIDDAEKAGLKGKDNWRKYPRAMLSARATGELCRDLFADCLAGLSYTMEELSDGDLVDELDLGDVSNDPDVTTKPATTRRRATRAVTRPAQPADNPDPPTEPDRGPVPDLPEPEPSVDSPADDDSDIIDADVVEVPDIPEPTPPPPAADPWPEGEWQDDAPAPTTDTGSRMTGPARIAMLMADKLGIKGSNDEVRDRRLEAIRQILDLDAAPASSKELTPEQLSTVIAHLAKLDDYQEPSEAGEPDTEASAASTPPASDAATSPPSPASEDQLADRRARRVTPPGEWTADAWRDFLKARKVKVTEALRRANELGAELDPPVAYPTIDDLTGSAVSGDLMGWIEDTSLERAKT